MSPTSLPFSPLPVAEDSEDNPTTPVPEQIWTHRSPGAARLYGEGREGGSSE